MLETSVTQTKYLNFVQIEDLNRKTTIWEVRNLKYGYVLGSVKWYSSWRQYCFWPSVSTVYSPDCLNDIVAFIKEQMSLRKSAVADSPTKED